MYPDYLTQGVSHTVFICVLLSLCYLSCLILKKKKKTLSITAKSQIDPQGAKDTPMTHRQKRLQSFQQYLFMCVTEQQATTNQYSDAIQQYA